MSSRTLALSSRGLAVLSCRVLKAVVGRRCMSTQLTHSSQSQSLIGVKREGVVYAPLSCKQQNRLDIIGFLVLLTTPLWLIYLGQYGYIAPPPTRESQQQPEHCAQCH